MKKKSRPKKSKPKHWKVTIKATVTKEVEWECFLPVSEFLPHEAIEEANGIFSEENEGGDSIVESMTVTMEVPKEK